MISSSSAAWASWGGTAATEVLDYLGLEATEKAVLLLAAPRSGRLPGRFLGQDEDDLLLRRQGHAQELSRRVLRLRKEARRCFAPDLFRCRRSGPVYRQTVRA